MKFLSSLNKDSPAAEGARKPDQFRAAGLRLQPGPPRSVDLPGQLEKFLQAAWEEAGADLQCKGKVLSRLQEKPYPAFTARQEGGSWEHPPGKSSPFTPGIPEERFLPSPLAPTHKYLQRHDQQEAEFESRAEGRSCCSSRRIQLPQMSPGTWPKGMGKLQVS